MKRRSAMTGFCLGLIWLVSGLAWAGGPSEIKSPEAFFGFKPGADRMLVDYEQLCDYLKTLAAASPRVKMIEVGHSPMGKPMFLAVISSEENILNLDKLKETARRLALETDLPPAERDRLVATGRAFVMVSLSMHSDEVSPSQMLPLYAYELATTRDEAVLKQLADVVLLATPNHNPDGMDLVVDYYRKNLGTRYEGASLPGVYHKYVGHDNNRDFVALTQDDTRVINRLFSTEWFPQVLLEKHQMGDEGPRFFVPPNHDPIAEGVDEAVWNWIGVFGMNMAKDMGGAGLTGVVQHWIFDMYWPGSVETGIYKNIISMLTENASCRVATPVYVEPTELRGEGKGLAEYKKSVNMPAPWPGGWWKLSDLVEYELASIRSLVRTASLYRAEILRLRNDLCRKEVEKGRTQAPAYFVLPGTQRDRSELRNLLGLLTEHGVHYFQLTKEVKSPVGIFSAGDIVVPLAQPYRSFIKEVMENQHYPVRHYTPDGEMIRPYDITSWSLPLHMGVESKRVDSRLSELESVMVEVKSAAGYFGAPPLMPKQLWAVGLPVTENGSFRAAFAAMTAGLPVKRTEQEMKVGGATLPKGSFLVFPAGEDRTALNQVVAEAGGTVIVIPSELTVSAQVVTKRRIALVETYFHDMDAGWTRFLFDRYHVPYTVVHPGDFEKTDFARDFDVVVFPSGNKEVLMTGQMKMRERYFISDLPPEYAKGIGPKGMDQLMTFLNKGGLIVAWGGSTGLFTESLGIPLGEKEGAAEEKKEEKKEEKGKEKPQEKFQLPIRDVGQDLVKKGLLVPGSWLRVNLRSDSPLTAGLAAEGGVFYHSSVLFQTSVPELDMDRRVIASFPEENVLLSGYADKAELLANRAAMVWCRKGKGQFVLMAFNPQFRCSTPATYKLLFNALLLPAVQ